MRELGTVSRFEDVKGFGAIRCDTDSRKLFVHFRGIRGTGYRSLSRDDRVSFEVATDATGRPCAADVVVVEDHAALEDDAAPWGDAA